MISLKRLRPRLPQIEKEALYQKLLEASQDKLQLEEVCLNLEEGIVITDAKGHPIFVNRKADDWLGGIRTASKQPLWDQTQDPSFAAFLRDHVVTSETRLVHVYHLQSDAQRPAATYAEGDTFTSPHFPGLAIRGREIFRRQLGSTD